LALRGRPGYSHGASGRVVGEKEGAREKKNKQYQWNDRLEQGLARESDKHIHMELCRDELKLW
jgi:hypothetical protein